jgi:hypothetical protein
MCSMVTLDRANIQLLIYAHSRNAMKAKSDLEDISVNPFGDVKCMIVMKLSSMNGVMYEGRLGEMIKNK